MKPETLQKMKMLINSCSPEELNEINEVVRHRYQVLRARKTREAMNSLREGDIARIGAIRPRYMQGLKVLILKRRQTKFECRALEPVQGGRRSGSNVFIIPATCLIKVQDSVVEVDISDA